MPTLGVDQFKSKLTGGGARANLFQVTCNFPGFAGGSSELASFMIKGASLPTSTMSPIEVPFRGRKLKIAGDRTFPEWTIKVINDVPMKLRDAFERWMNGINQHQSNIGRTNPKDYMTDWSVAQLDKSDPLFCWLHACLHKIEGDSGNSRYWYAKAGRCFDAFVDSEAELHAIGAAIA